MRPYNVYLRKDHSWQFTSLSGPKKGSSNFLIWIGGCQKLMPHENVFQARPFSPTIL